MTRGQANVIIALLAVLVLAWVIAPVFRTVVLHPVERFVGDWQTRNNCVAQLAESAPPWHPGVGGYVSYDPRAYCRNLLGVTPPPEPTPRPLVQFNPNVTGPGASAAPAPLTPVLSFEERQVEADYCQMVLPYKMSPLPSVLALVPAPPQLGSTREQVVQSCQTLLYGSPGATMPPLPRGFISFSSPPIPLPSVP